MKKINFMLFAAMFATLTGTGLYGEDYSKEIAEVKEGIRTEAKASWWGFDKSDATKCLQDAIDSGVKKLVVDNTGSEWIVNPIKLASDQEIIFSDGVVVSAIKGGFPKIGDSLFSSSGGKNIILRGEGNATLQMNKSDYQDKSKYKQGEYRNCIRIGGCENLKIRNLTLKSSGGDGIYIGAGARGYSENVLIENVRAFDHHRMGLTIISVENLLVRKCVFNSSKGASPEAGMDFEPNKSTERLVNCVVEDCEFSNNAMTGASISPHLLTCESKPVSITFRRCVFNNNGLGLHIFSSRKTTFAPVTGKVEFIDCQIKDCGIGILFKDQLANGLNVIFRNFTIDNNKAKNRPAMELVAGSAEGKEIGGITFDNTTVLDDNHSGFPIKFKRFDGGMLSKEIGGTLYLRKKGETARVDLQRFIDEERQKNQDLGALSSTAIDLGQLTPPATDAKEAKNPDIFIRWGGKFLQWAEKGAEITFDVRVKQIGSFYSKPYLRVTDPNGKELRKTTLEPDGQFHRMTFRAEVTGIHTIECEASPQVFDISSSHRGNGFLMEDGLNMISPNGKLYFQVPAGVKEIRISVAGEEKLDAALCNPAGETVRREQNIDSQRLISASRDDAGKSEIWSVEFSRAVGKVKLRLPSPLIPVVSTNPETLLLVKGE